jgi:hypothetical protein
MGISKIDDNLKSDHKSLPMTILKEFRNEYKKVCYFDVKSNGKIKCCCPNSFDFERGFHYSNELEKKVFGVENKIGTIIKEIKNGQFNKSTDYLKDFVVRLYAYINNRSISDEIVKDYNNDGNKNGNYFKLQCGLNPIICEKINDEVYKYTGNKKNYTNNMLPEIFEYYVKYYKTQFKYYEPKIFNIPSGVTNTFVLTPSLYSGFVLKNQSININILFPITPRYALVLCIPNSNKNVLIELDNNKLDLIYENCVQVAGSEIVELHNIVGEKATLEYIKQKFLDA